MTAIAKRKVRETWRHAVGARAAEKGCQEACLAAFDRYRAAGLSEAEAAFRALEERSLLWAVSLPGEGQAAISAAVPVV